MVDATTRFFEDLQRRGHEPLLEKLSGVIRFDLRERAQTQHWMLRIDRGRMQVSREDEGADSVLSTSPQLFEEMATGREDGIAALLRGDVTVTGDARLVLQIERLFPGPPDSTGPRRLFGREAY
ncbi:SCP2 sterol-binding domain-containing protein [Micromonospora sp. NPDC000207]|uniref:SCP2 sterol-binding domain-containing protein n=1 Tax=unclassified Micromonospora TaxID=2617518 RepID=UPI00331D01E1